jgi:hypothetical protein
LAVEFEEGAPYVQSLPAGVTVLRRAPLLTGCLLLSSCVLSIDGYVPLDEALEDPGLAGEWRLDGSRERVVIHSDGDTGYEIDYLDPEGRQGRFLAVLGRLGDRLVMDLWPMPPKDGTSDVYQGALIPGHVLLVLEMGRDTLRVAVPALDSLRAALEAGTVTLPWLLRDETVILTASTARLRAGLPAHLSRPGALDQSDLWLRSTTRDPEAR